MGKRTCVMEQLKIIFIANKISGYKSGRNVLEVWKRIVFQRES
jgi:hypothetical protein